jgi:hypothetical protein
LREREAWAWKSGKGGRERKKDTEKATFDRKNVEKLYKMHPG